MSINPLNDISRVYLEQVAESHVPGHPAEKLGAVTAIPKDEQEAARQRTLAKAKAMREKKGIKEAAKPDFLDFDDDGNKTEPMKKALKDKAKKKNLDEAGGRHGGGSMVGQPGGPPARNQKPQGDTPSKSVNNVSRTEVRFGKKSVQEAKKPNDGNLANNYPPYDEVTRGDVIAGRLGKDQMGGKKKLTKEGYSNWREDLREVMSSIEKKDDNAKITEKKINNKIKTSAMGGGITLPEAVENLGGTLLDVVELDEKAESEQQQKLFGLALSVKRGQTPRSEVSDAVLKIVDDMSEKKIRDFAKTKHEGIPKKVEEATSDITPLSPQELQVQRQKAQLDARLATLRKQSFSKMKKPEVVSNTTQEVQREESAADKALAIVKASMGSGLMTGKEKPAKLTAAQKEARQKAAAAYQKRTSDYLYSSPRD